MGKLFWKADIYMKDGLHLSGKRGAVFAGGLIAAVDSGMGNITNITNNMYVAGYICVC